MSKQRLTATDRVRNEIDGLFADPERELGEVLEEVARLSVRLVMQSALEAEVTEFLGRERYARGDRARAGSRNGYGDTTIKTTAGAVELKGHVRQGGVWGAPSSAADGGVRRHRVGRAGPPVRRRVRGWGCGPR